MPAIYAYHTITHFSVLERLEMNRSNGKNVPEKHKAQCHIPSLTKWKMWGGRWREGTGGLEKAVLCAQNIRRE